ncbi:DUF4956 domain-containing protein [Murimonas intestini]|uniref:Uncharacterized protein DUF4956 n=1 Tax=Murimonas intestini TaxID=1337051 RepID=A0AB73T9Y7_9FIRM|nr:DUF4956 domain-containing protein [Murimonas intestini]MCR1839176.1 DUF4956 domain-containing protein [Murimonas intestini]MCR1864472.1 DUF4956 domain-containing protein [Murimonas intestini]MCR1882082.1 DUF4956 domain-containing protein [Murimonas intestini]
MRELIASMLEGSGSLSTEAIILHIVSSAIISMAIYISYWYTHTGTAYSRKFNVSLVTLTILTGTVMTVIGNNIALSLGMVGALSIVRFRTAIKDSRDTTYIFWAIIVGICCGVGDYLVASVGSCAVFVVLLFLGRVRNENRILLIIRSQREKEMDIEGVVFSYFNKKALLKVKNTTENIVEFIYEMPRSTYNLTYKQDQGITQKLYSLGGIEYVNIVTQSDEISG